MRAAQDKLAHCSSVERRYLIHHSHLTRRSTWVLIGADVFLGQLIDAVVGAIFGYLSNLAPDLEVAVRIVRVLNGDRHVRAAFHVLVLLASASRVHNDVSAVIIDPDRSYLRGSVGHQRRQVSKCFFLEQVFVLIRYRGCHLGLLFIVEGLSQHQASNALHLPVPPEVAASSNPELRLWKKPA